MKTTLLSLLPLLLAASGGALDAVAQDATMATAPSVYILERGPHHRVVQTVTSQTGADGATSYRTNTYTELASGMHYLSNGQWVETQEVVEVAADGSSAFARQGPHAVIWSANANSVPATDLSTSDGKRFQSRVLGLAYYSAASGKSVLIAQIKDAFGQVVAPNQVLYPDCFSDVRCDLRGTYTKAGYEADVILRQQLPDPATYGFDPGTTIVQVWTEFFDPPAPQLQRRVLYTEADPAIRQAMVDPDMKDDFLDFDAMHIGLGKAFSISGQGSADGMESLVICKEWTTISNRTFLVEGIPYQSLKTCLGALPLTASANLRPKRSVQVATGKQPIAPRSRFVAALPKAPDRKSRPRGEMQMAKLTRPAEPGVVLDYVILNGASGFTFQSDTTYYVNGSVSLTATTIFEGGSVIKYTNSSSASISLPSGSAGSIKFQGSAYHPVVFTSMSDDTVGDKIASSTGNPTTNYFGNPCLNIDGSTTNYPNPFLIQNVRFAYAKLGISAVSGSGHVLTHAQLVNCQNGVQAWYGTDVTLRNALFYNVLTNFSGDSSTINCQNVTSDTANYLRINSTVNLVNCLLTSVTNVSYYSTSYTSNLTSSAGVFQTVGAGAHYLAADSPYRSVGTTSIDPTLQSDLRKKTTYPPVVYPQQSYLANQNLVLYPQAPRNSGTPDLGWHYDPIDFAFGWVYVTNATITVKPGTVIGVYMPWTNVYGLALGDGARLICEGSPTNLNHIVRYTTVQEATNTNWSGPFGPSIITSWLPLTTPPEVRFRFTDWSMLGNETQHLSAWSNYAGMLPIKVMDCQFHGGKLWFAGPAAGVTNNLFERVTTVFYTDGASTSTLRNNLFFAGTIDVGVLGSNTNAIVFMDNFLDKVGMPGNFTISNAYNGYISGYARLQPTNINDKILTASSYLAGTLGNYYLPTTSALINTGSTNASSVGMYHYTTVTSQAKETNSVVDLSYHYIALNGGLPSDSDGDLLPDYLEDSNGDGVRQTTETNWPNADTDGDGVSDFIEWLEGRNPLVAGRVADTNGLVNLRIFSPLK